MKKYIIIAVFLVVLVFGGIGGFLFWQSQKGDEGKQGDSEWSLVTKLVSELPLGERPFVFLTPSEDGHWVTLEVQNIPQADEVEYEIIYEMSGAGGERLDQGVVGHGEPLGDVYNSGPRLFGSESSGKYKFDQDVEGKNIVLRFRLPDEVLKFEDEWRLYQGEEELVSPDEKFTLSASFPSGFFYILLPTGGLPGDLEGEVVAGPYGVFTSGEESLKNGEASFEFEEANPDASIYFWDGSTWKELTTKVEDGKITAETSALGIFVAAVPAVSAPTGE